jgi:hypothetical protein
LMKDVWSMNNRLEAATGGAVKDFLIILGCARVHAARTPGEDDRWLTLIGGPQDLIQGRRPGCLLVGRLFSHPINQIPLLKAMEPR